MILKSLRIWIINLNDPPSIQDLSPLKNLTYVRDELAIIYQEGLSALTVFLQLIRRSSATSIRTHMIRDLRIWHPGYANPDSKLRVSIL